MSEEVHKILTEMVEVHQRMHDRNIRLKAIVPGGISDQDMDESLLELLRAKLELAEHE